MTGRRPLGILLGATGLTVIATASAYPPMWGCPPPVDDPAAPALTPSLAVDYCAGGQPMGQALDLFLLLNAVGVVTFLGGVALLSLRRLVWRGSGAS